jgi:hypothetical protein
MISDNRCKLQSILPVESSVTGQPSSSQVQPAWSSKLGQSLQSACALGSFTHLYCCFPIAVITVQLQHPCVAGRQHANSWHVSRLVGHRLNSQSGVLLQNQPVQACRPPG